MPPVEPSVIARSNSLPLALFSGQALLVVGLSTHIIHHIRVAAASLPPSPSTRNQTSVRNRNATVFAVLALLSIASVTTFSVAWRLLSYLEWADKGSHESPVGLWTGWYGTGDAGVGTWRLGDWWSDVSLFQQSDEVALHSTGGYLYTTQHFIGLTAAALFFGVEGRRRNLPKRLIAASVLLSQIGSLGCALNLFFIVILFTPIAQHTQEIGRLDATFTPHPALFSLPIVGSLFALLNLPALIHRGRDITALRVGYIAVPFYLAFTPQITPLSWGQRHSSKAAAHRSYVWPFRTIGLSSFVMCWDLFMTLATSSAPQNQTPVWDLFRNVVGKQEKPNSFMTTLSNTSEKLKLISSHPAISVTGSDVLFTTIGLLAWTFIRNLNVNDILENSLLCFLPYGKTEKHVAFREELEDEPGFEVEVPVVTPKKRGRPRKSPAVADTTSTGTLRRSTRRRARADYESDAEETYEPPAKARQQVKQIEADGATDIQDVVRAGESTSLALLLTFLGGVGQLAASVLGAEATA